MTVSPYIRYSGLRLQTIRIIEESKRLTRECEKAREATRLAVDTAFAGLSKSRAACEHSRLLIRQSLGIIKTCACGKEYTLGEWIALPLVGYMRSKGVVGELRTCVCNSTIMKKGSV